MRLGVGNKILASNYVFFYKKGYLGTLWGYIKGIVGIVKNVEIPMVRDGRDTFL